MFNNSFVKAMIGFGLSFYCLCVFAGLDHRQTDEENNYISFHKIDKAWRISKGRGVKVAALDWLFDMSLEASQKYIDPISLVAGHEVGSSEPWHGEWMAEIVHRIAPEGKIIPIRAQPPREENQDKNRKEQPCEQFLIEGIRYRADHGAVAVTNFMGPVKHTEKLIEIVKYAEKMGTVFIDVHPEYLDKKGGSYVFCDSSQRSPLIIHTGIISVPKYPLEPETNRDIYTWPFEINPKFKDGWGFSNGPPIIAGVIALMKSVNPALSVEEVKNIIIRTADMKGEFRPLNAEKALIETNACGQSLSFEETLEKMMDIAGVKPGMIIGEIGSGAGPFTFRMAERVGKKGKIYANDIDPGALDSIDNKEIQNIETVLGEVDDPVFPVKNLDMVIMRSVFHDLENPLSMLENLKKYLKPEVPCVIIEQLPFNTPLRRPLHVMTKEQLLGIVEKSSFKLTRTDSSLPAGWLVYIFKVDTNKEKNIWTNWINEFRAIVRKVQEFEKEQNVSSGEKRIAWERVLNSYRDNNPDTEEDELLREYINKRIDLLMEHEKQSVLTQKDTPGTLKSKEVFGFHLRSEYRSVDLDEISEILLRLGFKGRRSAESGDFKNQFEPMSLNGDDVVVDHASGLMWHRAGSKETLDYFDALEWTNNLNIKCFAGYSDWRLPTVEEAVSLFETKKMNGEMRIDLSFSNVQLFVWTGDAYYPGRLWVAIFSGSSLWEELKTNIAWVRPVRSLR